MTTYEFLRYGEMILSTPSISNFIYLEWLNYHTLILKIVLFDQKPQIKLSD